MYEAFFGLREKPFAMHPDPDFFFLSERHDRAYTLLRYALTNAVDFAVITGEIGTGKTTLVRRLLQNLPANFELGLITNTHPEMGELLPWVLQAFDLPTSDTTQVARFERLQHFFLQTYGAGRKLLLAIDEAQNLTPNGLEAVRLLSNINVDKHSVLQVMLVGQPELKDRLAQPELAQLAQRVAISFDLTPLAHGEVPAYIEHRLSVAGAGSAIFTAEACARLAEVTGGIPRRINILCDTALVFAYGKDSHTVDTGIVNEVVDTLG